MQNDPDQPAEPMGNRPDGLLVSQARHQAAIHGLEDASFGFDRGVGTLIENTPHVAVAFRGAVARGNLRTLFVSGACANPRRKVLLRRKRRCPSPHFGQDLLRRIHSQSGDLRQPVHGIHMLASADSRSRGLLG